VVLGVTSVLRLALFVVGVHAHQPFVDDYRYAAVSRSFYSGCGVLHDILHSGQTAPLVPALAMALTAIAGLYGALAVELPILLLLVAGAFALARQWVGPRPAAVIALLVGLNCSVFGYSIMPNFALASTRAPVWRFVACRASDRLRDMRWCAVLGLAAAVDLTTVLAGP